ncbi:MAG TPA: hypothetical protein VJH20_03085 [Candidatus Nanoarchaeia archaeon]|nr:hypothetical protein [Candidatus Nanoarchaeia archaeon]
MTYFCVTIDTECDMPNWKPKLQYSIKNTEALLKLHALFSKYEIQPTYLITYPVATEALSKDILTSLYKNGDCEIGAHFHPWTTPPINIQEIKDATFPFQLEYNNHLQKLQNLTNAIIKSFRVKPKSYRAGRFGLDLNGLNIIESLGYEIDTSVTPLTNWGSDFRNASVHPYYLDYNGLSNPGKSKVLEVPVSIDVNIHKSLRKIYRLSSEKTKAILGLVGIKRLWLRPSLSSSTEMVKLSRLLISNNIPVLNMMFHSNELTTFSSPFNKTQQQLNNYFNKLEGYFKFIKSNEIESITLNKYKKEYDKSMVK